MARNVLHLLTTGNSGGIECLCKDISKYSKLNNVFCFAFSGGVIANEMIELGANVEILNIKNARHILELYKKLSIICDKYSIETIVVHHQSPAFYLIAPILLRNKGIEYYIYLHANAKDVFLTNDDKRGLIKKIFFSLAVRKSKGNIAISNSVKDSFLKLFNNMSGKTVVIYNGIDVNKFTPVLKNENNDFTVIYIGRLVKKKGVSLLLESIKQLKKKGILVKCLIVGDGPERNKLESYVFDAEIGDLVKFYGVQRNICEWHHKADVFVHPAICEEGFGITIAEAMASGLPCVAFKRGAIPEILDDGVTGYILNEVSVNDLARAIKELYLLEKNDIQKWNYMKKSAHEKARNYDIRSTCNQFDMLITDGVIK